MYIQHVLHKMVQDLIHLCNFDKFFIYYTTPFVKGSLFISSKFNKFKIEATVKAERSDHKSILI